MPAVAATNPGAHRAGLRARPPGSGWVRRHAPQTTPPGRGRAVRAAQAISPGARPGIGRAPGSDPVHVVRALRHGAGGVSDRWSPVPGGRRERAGHDGAAPAGLDVQGRRYPPRDAQARRAGRSGCVLRLPPGWRPRSGMPYVLQFHHFSGSGTAERQRSTARASRPAPERSRGPSSRSTWSSPRPRRGRPPGASRSYRRCWPADRSGAAPAAAGRGGGEGRAAPGPPGPGGRRWPSRWVIGAPDGPAPGSRSSRRRTASTVVMVHPVAGAWTGTRRARARRGRRRCLLAAAG